MQIYTSSYSSSFWCCATVWSDWVHPWLQVSWPTGPTDRLWDVRLFQEPVWRWIHSGLPEGKYWILGFSSHLKVKRPYFLLTDFFIFPPTLVLSGTVQLYSQYGSLQLAALPAANKRQTQWQHHAGQPGPPYSHWCVFSVVLLLKLSFRLLLLIFK